LVTQSFWNKAGDLSKNGVVVGCEPEYFLIKDWKVVSGELFGSTHERTASRVAVLGYTVAGDLFGASSPIGERMMINGVPFTVIGVSSERGQGLDVSNEDSQIGRLKITAFPFLLRIRASEVVNRDRVDVSHVWTAIDYEEKF
jgi:putative ABC transport system permease protein